MTFVLLKLFKCYHFKKLYFVIVWTYYLCCIWCSLNISSSDLLLGLVILVLWNLWFNILLYYGVEMINLYDYL